MYQLNRKAYFSRKLKKLLKKDPGLTPVVIEVLTALAKNPRDQKLRSHKVIAKYDGNLALAVDLSGDLRIIWRYGERRETIQILDLIDVGPHSGSKKVYQ